MDLGRGAGLFPYPNFYSIGVKEVVWNKVVVIRLEILLLNWRV
jgi:hypothetical protein